MKKYRKCPALRVTPRPKSKRPSVTNRHPEILRCRFIQKEQLRKIQKHPRFSPRCFFSHLIRAFQKHPEVSTYLIKEHLDVRKERHLSNLEKLVTLSKSPRQVRQEIVCKGWPQPTLYSSRTLTNFHGKTFLFGMKEKEKVLYGFSFTSIRCCLVSINRQRPALEEINSLTHRAGHFRYFWIFSIIKNDCFAFFIKLINCFCTSLI